METRAGIIASSIAVGEAQHSSGSSWLLGSGVQSAQGFFYAWYDLDLNAFALPYPEITGYGVSALCRLFDRSGNPAVLERCAAAFNWLDRHVLGEGPGLVGGRGSPLDCSRQPRHYAFAFDTGIVATALARFAKRASQDRVWKSLTKISESFRQHLWRSDGTFWPLFDLSSGVPVSSDCKWSHRFSGYQVKALMFCMLMCEEGQGAISKQEIVDVCEGILNEQLPSGAFPSFNNGETHLHAHFYALEGLAVAAATMKRPEWLESVRHGYVFAEDLLLDNGYIPTQILGRSVTVPYERTDILAQLLRMGCYLRALDDRSKSGVPLALYTARDRLVRYLVREGPHTGGFLFGCDFDGTIKRHVSAGASFFADQALEWFELASAGVRLDARDLI